jgi:carbon storage regulator
MLILKRTLNQQIIIAGDICITILAIESHRVKIGVQAPPHIHILRGELVAQAQTLSFSEAEERQPDAEQ